MKQEIVAAKTSYLEVFRVEGVEGKEEKKVVGSASIREGERIIHMKLFTFVKEKFYVVVSKDDPSRYVVMTREENRNPKSTNKYFWHVIGSGRLYPGGRIVELHLDLFTKPVFLKLQPDFESGLKRKAA